MISNINLLHLVVGFSCFLVITGHHTAEAAQGCPSDGSPCQEYCNQQSCSVGYCGNFAWIQCICRRCGDEWNWYDKVLYNPDKLVNQTEFDSLKLNGTAPLILTNSGATNQASAPGANSSTGGSSSRGLTLSTRVMDTPREGVAEDQVAVQKQQAKAATLTTLLIPDLSDSSKFEDLRDIPDEHSEKFLDFLTKNHEKLVQATANRAQKDSSQQPDELAEDEEQQQANSSPASDTSSPSSTYDEEDQIGIQISSSNNNAKAPSISTTSQMVSSSTKTTLPSKAQLVNEATFSDQPQPEVRKSFSPQAVLKDIS